MKNREAARCVALFGIVIVLLAGFGQGALQQQGSEIAVLRAALGSQASQFSQQMNDMQNQMQIQRAELSALSARLPLNDEAPAADKSAVRSASPKADVKNPDGSFSYSCSADLLEMKPCLVKFLGANPCTGIFQDASGQKIYIGSPDVAFALNRFVFALEEGQTYELPAAFLEFLESGETPTAHGGATVVEETF